MSNTCDYRLPAPWGCVIDRNEVYRFTFEGVQYQGYLGDTLTSALAANDVRLLSRSFKYHRPRASYSIAGHDANAYICVNKKPNENADLIQLSDSTVVTAQNVLGSVGRDFGALTEYLARFLPVGFYYRAFYRPNGIWKYWERLFRRVAGLGRIDTRHNRVVAYEKQYLFADVVVIGAGPAGLSAAIAAAESAASVVLVEESPQVGGSLNYARFGRQAQAVTDIRQSLVDAVASNLKIRVLTGSTCNGWYEDNWLSVDSGKTLYKVRAAQVVLCTGSVEQPAVFRNNDLPGVLTGSGVQRLLRLYGVRPGDRAVVFTANIDGYDVARDLIDAGVAVAALVDTNQLKTEVPKWLSEYEVEYLPNYEMVEAQPGPGNRTIKGCVLVRHGNMSEVRKIDCDLIVTSVGYAPLGQLACHSGGQLEYDDTIHAYRITRCPNHGQVAGSANHIYALDAVLQDGNIAGTRAAAAALGKAALICLNDVVDRSAVSMNHPYPIYPHKKGKEFVDFDEDQTIADLNNAVADGFSHPELAKRYSTTGMGPSQGRMSASNALRIVAQAGSGDLGGRTVTTQRPPYRPLSFAVLAGQSFEPERLSPMHDWHIQNGAELMPAGLWQRPALYRRNGDRQRDIADEVAAIRENVGLIDVSTLGGIEIRGPDASEFLNRAYTFAYAKQPIGRTRYLLMTDETGSIVDDGVACRLADDHFYVTTTTTGSDAVYRNMLRQCAEWCLDLTIINTTSAYAAINVAGPLARTVMSRLDSDIDFSKDAFPYLAVREGSLEGITARALRVGFVGELSYELHVPSSRALQLWERLMLVGAGDKIRAVGVEAQRILRLEKGHIIVGQDTDGLTHPGEASLGWAVARSKPRFVGRAAINHFECRGVDRTLVGFRLKDSIEHFPEECNIIVDGSVITGRVTSIAHSAVVGAVVGLAYVSPQRSAIGSEFRIKRSDGQLINATVVDLPFFDPDNAQQEL